METKNASQIRKWFYVQLPDGIFLGKFASYELAYLFARCLILYSKFNSVDIYKGKKYRCSFSAR